MRLALVVLVAAPVFALAQSVEGPGDNVLCSNYPAVHLLKASQRSGSTFRLFQPPPAIAVTGKPFSARHVTQDMQIRADGTQICKYPYVSVIYRDSAGRTRTETSFGLEGPDGKPAPARVTIVDPAAQIEYDLDMANRIAYRLHPRKISDIRQGPRGVPEPPNPAVQSKTQSLGTHTFQGVDVEGSLTTTTVTRPGSAGPVIVTSENWSWPYLGTVVLSKQVNPGNRSTNAYVQLSTAEPDPALFRVPDGWQIVEGVVSSHLLGSGGEMSEMRTTAGYQYTARIAPPLHADYVVREAPYTAEQTSESASNLAGPARPPFVEPPTKLYRDPYGRTRIDRPAVPFAPGDKSAPPVFPEITDPIDGVRITLDPIHKVAYRFTLPQSIIANEPRFRDFGGYHPRSVETTTDLGEKTFEGVTADGTLDTYRTPAGANGNDGEITETEENWYSPELKLVVLSKQNSVASVSTMQLTQISTSEPDQSLFEIPPGYTVVDAKATVTITVTQP